MRLYSEINKDINKTYHNNIAGKGLMLNTALDWSAKNLLKGVNYLNLNWRSLVVHPLVI